MSSVSIKSLRTELARLVRKVELPKTNSKVSQEILYNFAKAKVLEELTKQYKTDAEKSLKSITKINNIGEQTLLADENIAVVAKISNGRKSFDKALFITKLVEKYKLSKTELTLLSDECTKQSKNIVSLSVEYK